MYFYFNPLGRCASEISLGALNPKSEFRHLRAKVSVRQGARCHVPSVCPCAIHWCWRSHGDRDVTIGGSFSLCIPAACRTPDDRARSHPKNPTCRRRRIGKVPRPLTFTPPPRRSSVNRTSGFPGDASSPSSIPRCAKHRSGGHRILGALDLYTPPPLQSHDLASIAHQVFRVTHRDWLPGA